MQGFITGNQPARNQAAAMRVNALVQTAYSLSRDHSDPEHSYNDLRVMLGSTRDDKYHQELSFANGDFTLAYAVARGEVDLGAINPSAYLTMAYRGTGRYTEALPVRAIATMPTWDRMCFAIADKTELHSLAEIAARHYPLRVSIRRSLGHGTRFVIDQVLAVHGFSLQDIEAWGGSIHYVDTPNDPARYQAISDGALDAVFDEGVKGWGYVALDNGMQFLDLDEKSRARLGDLGWPMGPVRAYFPKQREEIMAVSFGGWPLFTRASLPEGVAYQMCHALDSARERIAFDTDDPVQLSDLSEGTDAAPRDVPLHPGAERYYREHGCKV